MNSVGVVGGNKKFIGFLESLFCITKTDCRIITEKRIECSKYYDFIIFNHLSHKAEFSLDCSYILVNMDSFKECKSSIRGDVITYGFGSKNTVTLSSIESETGNLVYCVQRYIEKDSMPVLQPQEVPVAMNFDDEELLYALMAGLTIVMIECYDFEKIKLRLNERK